MEDVEHLPRRGVAGGVVPHEHQPVLLHDRPDAERLRAVGLVLVGDGGVVAVGAPLPPVERALHAVADDLAAVADVGAEVLAVGLQDVQLAVLVAPGHEVLAEVLQGPDLAGGELRRPADLPPAGDLPRERDLHGDLRNSDAETSRGMVLPARRRRARREISIYLGLMIDALEIDLLDGSWYAGDSHAIWAAAAARGPGAPRHHLRHVGHLEVPRHPRRREGPGDLLEPPGPGPPRHPPPDDDLDGRPRAPVPALARQPGLHAQGGLRPRADAPPGLLARSSTTCVSGARPTSSGTSPRRCRSS